MPEPSRRKRTPQNTQRFLERANSKLNPKYMPGFHSVNWEKLKTHLTKKKWIAPVRERLRFTPKGIRKILDQEGMVQRWEDLSPAQLNQLTQYVLLSVNPKGDRSKSLVLATLKKSQREAATKLFAMNDKQRDVPIESTAYEEYQFKYFYFSHLVKFYEMLGKKIRRGIIDWRPKNGKK